MKLLLDEMLSRRIAEQLCTRGHDVAAVDEDPGLRGLSDTDLFAHAQRDERAVVTYNRDDFLAMDREYRDRGREHRGIVVLHPRRFPQGSATIAALIAALAAFAGAGAPYSSFVHWRQ